MPRPVRLPFALAVVALSLLPFACVEDSSSEGAPPDGEFDVALPTGKADSPWNPCLLDGVVMLVNDPSRSVEGLVALGLHSRAAKNLVAARDGLDASPGTADDTPFADLEAVDAVPYVGPVAMDQLVAAVAPSCPAAGRSAEVIFSPQPWEKSHLARSAQLIDAAQRSIDVAMYSFRENAIRDALGRAVTRGVKVRFIFDTASEDRKSPDGTMSAKLEDLGIDVRYVNKIMHHKFMIVDGPQDDPLQALGTTLLSGSGNWSSSAGTRFDENTAVLTGIPELALRFQREFDTLWANSRDFVWNDALAAPSTRPVEDWMLPDDPGVDAAYTSANFDTYVSANFGPTFTIRPGSNELADLIVAHVDTARESILVASGHLRSRPVAEAILRAKAANPDLQVRIYLDGQEYISEYTHAQQVAELDACLLAAADNVTKQQRCQDKGFYYAYAMVLAGIELKFKHYAYRWHYSYAPQMHHKYVVIDGRVVLSGSYNLSDNAEHNTMENVVVYHADAFPQLVAGFGANFDSMWATGDAQGYYDTLLDRVVNGTGSVPIVYDAMALTWEQVTTLKRAIRDACPAVDSEPYRARPEAYYTCSR